MTKKDDNNVVVKIADLSETQASHIIAGIIKSKQKYAPDSRGTIATGKQEEIRSLKQFVRKQLSLTSRK